MNPHVRAGLRTGAAVAGAAAALQAAPALSAVAPLRAGLMPRLAGRGRPGHVALTFDDGPDRTGTPRFLELLDERDVKATFFLLATMALRSPGIAKDIAAAGHEVAVHGWCHRPLPLCGPRATYHALARARDTLAAVTGETPAYFRPPYGVMTAAAHLACHRLGLTPVLWTAWGRDWRRRATPESIHATVTRGLASGGTILLHDSDCTSATGSWHGTLSALPRILDTCAANGWSPGPLREHGVGGRPAPGQGRREQATSYITVEPHQLDIPGTPPTRRPG